MTDKSPSLLPRYALCVALISSLFWGSLSQLDPFGLKSAVDLHSESLFMRLVGGPWYHSQAQDAITVVLIDDLYIQRLGEHWPMSYIQQDLLLNDILDLHPRAVFIDLLYSHDHSHPGSEDLAQYTETLGNPDVPVYLPFLIKDIQGLSTCDSPATGGDTPDPAELLVQNAVIPEVRQSGARFSYIGWTGCGNRYPARILGDEQYPTPAYALFRQICAEDNSPFPGCESLRNSTDNDTFAAPMVIRWGTGVSKEHQSALEKADIHCTRFDEQEPPTRFLFRQLLTMFTPDAMLSSTRERGLAERCTYTDTVHATWFLGASPEIRAYLKGMIENRVVLIGTQIEGVHDYIISPVNGRLPGVYTFGMALDNYLTYGDGYYKEMSDFTAWATEVLALMSIFLTTLLLWNLVASRWCQATDSPADRCRINLQSLMLFTIFRILLPLLFMLALSVLLWRVFHFAPLDWIGISLLAFVASPIALGDCLKASPLNELEDSIPLSLCRCCRRKCLSGASKPPPDQRPRQRPNHEDK